jgi:hypothetical protein
VRVNVYLPDDLGEQVKAELPDVNVSAVLQDALRRLLACDHERYVCADCGEDVDAVEVARAAMELLWRELLWAWEPLVDKGGTAEGAARVGKDVAVRLGVPGAESRPLPRPPRHAAARRAS